MVQAYSSLGGADGWPVLSKEELLIDLAEKYKKTTAQLLLRWALQHKLCIIPKTTKVDNLRINYNLFDFVISSEDMKEMDSLSRNQKFCWNSKHVK